MVAIAGIYQNGQLKLTREYSSKEPVKVIVTFLDEVEEQDEQTLRFSDFSFAESRKALENYKGSFSDSVIEERRTGV